MQKLPRRKKVAPKDKVYSVTVITDNGNHEYIVEAPDEVMARIEAQKQHRIRFNIRYAFVLPLKTVKGMIRREG